MSVKQTITDIVYGNSTNRARLLFKIVSRHLRAKERFDNKTFLAIEKSIVFVAATALIKNYGKNSKH